MVNGIPRGHAFVMYMASHSSHSHSATPTRSESNWTGTTAPSGPKPGNFDRNATWTVTKSDPVDLGDGRTQTEIKRDFSDGSAATSTLTRFADGTGKEIGERRSMPDSEGLQQVRVFETDIAADGTRTTTVRVFRVPAGESFDWNSGEAQQYFLETIAKIIPPGMGWRDVPEEATVRTDRPAPALTP